MFSLLRRITLEEPELLAEIVDVSKAKIRIEVKKVNLENEERWLERQEARQRMRERTLEKREYLW